MPMTRRLRPPDVGQSTGRQQSNCHGEEVHDDHPFEDGEDDSEVARERGQRERVNELQG